MPDTTPLPLPECPREGCPATIDHWHDGEGAAFDCTRQLGRACLGHESGRSNVATRCYAPRTQPAPARPPVTAILAAILAAADDAKRAHDQMCDLAETLLPDPQPAPLPPVVVLPTVDEVEKAWRAVIARGERIRDASQAVLDLVASRVPAWQPVAPGTVIKAGTRYRIEYGAGRANEHVASYDRKVDDSAPVLIDPRTVPAEPEGPRVAVAVQWLYNESATAWPPCSPPPSPAS